MNSYLCTSTKLGTKKVTIIDWWSLFEMVVRFNCTLKMNHQCNKQMLGNNWSILSSFYEQPLCFGHAVFPAARRRAWSVKIGRKFQLCLQVKLGAVLLVKLNIIFCIKLRIFALCTTGLANSSQCLNESLVPSSPKCFFLLLLKELMEAFGFVYVKLFHVFQEAFANNLLSCHHCCV